MIYLDFAAATPVCKKALAAQAPYFSDQFFNPSSPYLPAKHVRDNYEFAKNQIAHMIGAKGNDLIITSGATESINLAFTAVKANPRPNSAEILILSTEHASVRSAARAVAKASNAKLIELKVGHTGLIDLDDFRQKLSKNTVFVSVSLANNELGTIQPLSEIAAIIEKERISRLKTCQNADFCPIFLHSDASQALNLLDISVSRLGVDLLTINSAKIGGPKGVGALYFSHDVKLEPIIHGGGQETGLRSGTENVPAVIGFAAAAEETKAHLASNRKKYQNLTNILRAELTKYPVKPLFLGNVKHQLANFCPVSFPGIDAERIIYRLEDQEIYLSTGAACAANKGTASHVLQNIGLTNEEIMGSLRISLGVLNDESQIRTAAAAICKAVTEEANRHAER